MPTHYAFKTNNWIPGVEAAYQKALTRTEPAAIDTRPMAGRAPSRPDKNRVRDLIESLDSRGAWISEGGLRMKGANPPVEYDGPIIDTKIFVRNAMLLAAYLGDNK
jgi:hypothetical protein